MKALSIKQPHAEHILQGVKTCEIRSWATKHRGPLLICSSKVPARPCDHPLGQTICIIELLDVVPFTPGLSEKAMTHWRERHYAWVIGRVIPVKNISIKGRTMLFKAPADVLEELSSYIAESVRLNF
jgi:hypothetical protein